MKPSIYLQKMVRNFSRYNKYTIGTELRDISIGRPRFPGVFSQTRLYIIMIIMIITIITIITKKSG